MGKQLTFFKCKNAQVSMEFIFLVGLAFMVMVVFISSTRSEFDILVSEEERSLVKDVAVMVQHELIVASNVADGYMRTFEVPLALENMSYNIEIINITLVAYTDNYESVLNVPFVVGDVQKGDNVINKTGGVLYLN